MTESIDFRQEALKRGLTPQQADTFAQLAGDFMTQEMEKMRQSFAGQTSVDPTSYRHAYNGALERTLEHAQGAAINKTNQTGQGANPNAPSSIRTINLNFGGRSTKLNVASEADAGLLENFLKQLELNHSG